MYAAQFIGQAFVTAYNLIDVNKDKVEQVADVVIEKKEIYGDDLVSLLDAQKFAKPEIDWTDEEYWPKIMDWSKRRDDQLDAKIGETKRVERVSDDAARGTGNPRRPPCPTPADSSESAPSSPAVESSEEVQPTASPVMPRAVLDADRLRGAGADLVGHRRSSRRRPPGQGPDPAWSTWKPKRGTRDQHDEADRRPRRRLSTGLSEAGGQLLAVLSSNARHHERQPQGAAERDRDPQARRRATPASASSSTSNTRLYTLCGLGKNCSIEGGTAVRYEGPARPPRGARGRALHVQVRAVCRLGDRVHAAGAGRDDDHRALPREERAQGSARQAAEQDAAARDAAAARGREPRRGRDDRQAHARRTSSRTSTPRSRTAARRSSSIPRRLAAQSRPPRRQPGGAAVSRRRAGPATAAAVGSRRGAARIARRADGRVRAPARADGGARRRAARAHGRGRARRRRAAIERHRSRGKLLARERIDRLLDPGTAFLELGALAALGAVRRRRAVGRHRHRHRRRRGPGVRGRRERRDREGRLVLPAHGQEAPARAGGRRAEPAAVPLPRRLGRRVPAAPGRGLPRPRPLRPDLLQPGAACRRSGSRRSRS